MVKYSAVLIATLAVSACGAPTEEVAAHKPAQPAAAVPQVETPVADPPGDATPKNQQATLQSQSDGLRIERDRLAGQVDAHQADGQRRLAELKLQWKNALGPERERFAERARNEMESALMMDQEYRAQLHEADEKLQQTERELDAVRELETSLQK